MRKHTKRSHVQRKNFCLNQHPAFEDINDCFSKFPVVDLACVERKKIAKHVSSCLDCTEVAEFIKKADALLENPPSLTEEEIEMSARFHQRLKNNPFQFEEGASATGETAQICQTIVGNQKLKDNTATDNIAKIGRLRVLCIVPALNEGEQITRIIGAVPRKVVESILVVDGGSVDDTTYRAIAAGALVIRNERTYGVDGAIRSGIDYAIEHGYDILVAVPASGCVFSKQVERLVEQITNDNAEFVIGRCYMEGRKFTQVPLRWRITRRAYALLFSLLVGRWVREPLSGFLATRTSIFKDERIDVRRTLLDGYELKPYLLFKAIRLGYKVAEISLMIKNPTADNNLGEPKIFTADDWQKLFPATDWRRAFASMFFFTFGLKR